MNNEIRTAYVTRDTILKLLSDEETARVSTAETAPKLPAGEEYVDLLALDQGVQKAVDSKATMGHVLPRKAVLETTWSKIVDQFAKPGAAAPAKKKGS